MHGKFGKTIGKMICKVKVVNNEGEGPISFKQAFIRDSPAIILSLIGLLYEIYLSITSDFRIVDLYDQQYVSNNLRLHSVLLLVPAIWMILELITMLTNKKRRAIHDLIGKTVVLRTNVVEEKQTLETPNV